MSNEKRLQQIRDAARYKYPDERIHFIDGAKWADSHPAWVSVEDELPKENGKTQQSISVWATDGLTSGEFRYNFDAKTWTDMWGDPFDITHWMPLPQPPVKKGGEQ